MHSGALSILQLILGWIGFIDGANILWLSGVASPSHQLWSDVLQRALVDRGHNLTVLSVDSQPGITANLTHLHMEQVYPHFAAGMSSLFGAGVMRSVNLLAQYRAEVCRPALRSHGTRQLMDYPRQFRFQLVVHDFAGAHCLLGFVKRFGAPLVSASATTCPLAMAAASGNPQYPLTVPSNHATDYKMNWWQKLVNVAIYTYDNFIRWWSMFPHENAAAREYFDDPQLDVEYVAKSSLMTLVNLPPYDVIQPLYGNVIPVGGLHIKSPKALDETLENFMEASERGVVYFALGTNIDSKYFSMERAHAVLEAFKKFPSHRFLWKFDPSLLNTPVPDNVIMMKWLPQNDILAHPKTVAFIGHGGALSCHEAVWYGIPQLLIPFMIDQRQNAARATARGMAITLKLEDITAENVELALKNLLSDKGFKKKAMSFSKSFRDQPRTPLDRAIFWIEYVLRNQGDDFHIRSPGQDEPTWSNIEVTATLIVGFFVLRTLLPF